MSSFHQIAKLDLPQLRFELIRNEWSPHFEETYNSSSAILAYTRLGTGRIPDNRVYFDVASYRFPHARAGEIVLRPPGIPVHVIGHDDALSGTSLQCAFEPDYFVSRSRLSDWDRERLLNCLNIRSAPITNIMRRIAAELIRPGFGSEDIVEGLGRTLVFELARVFDSRTACKKPRGRLSPWQLRCVDDALYGARGAWPTKTEIAAACGLSPRYLAHAFLQTTGRTLGDHMQAARLESARQLLARSGLTIKQVALELGFPSLSSFSIAFKRAVGVSPREFGRMAGSKSSEKMLM